MVLTPWGDSRSLRERRLQPVRGAPQAEVEKNQRERLFAALVASMAERGYGATTVADLVELSGVSSRSFYDLFGDMQGCAKALVEELLRMAQGQLDAGESVKDLEVEGRRLFVAFATLIAAQPAAARVLLLEVFAAGPEVLESVERAITRYERRMRKRYEATPEREGMPDQIVDAIVGGVLEVARTRLRLGRAEEMPALGEDVIALALSYRPPPEPLRLGVRQKGVARESLEAADHSERAIRSLAVLCADQGYRATTVDDVVKLASMSSRTFYAHFSGKEDLMGAAIDSACAQCIAAAMPAFSRHAEWPAGIRAGMGAMLGFLASRPALARLLMVEVYMAGDFAIERRNRGVAPLGLLLENNTTEWQLMPRIVYELIAGGAARLIYREIARAGTQGLPGLAPILTYLTLSPFLGPEDAAAVANGDGGGRPPKGAAKTWVPVMGGALPLQTPVRRTASMALVTLLERTGVREEGGLTAAEIATEIGADPAEIDGYLRDLSNAGVIERIAGPGGGERYRSASPVHRTHIITKRQTEEMPLEDREDLSGQLRQLIEDDVEASIRGKAFDRRSERFLTRTPMKLDEQGWLELAGLHSEILSAGFEISARSAARLAETGERAIEVRSVQMLFEMPGAAEGDESEDG